jgi:hypothetical protein
VALATRSIPASFDDFVVVTGTGNARDFQGPVLIMKERRHMIPEAIRGMEKPIERALSSGACVESGRHLIELTPSGPVLRKKSVHREFIVANSYETHSCSSQHTRGMLPAP